MLRSLVVVAITVMLPATALAADTKPGKDASLRFALKTPKLQQELKVTRTADPTITFELTITGECQRSIAGEARRQGRPKMLKDETGQTYPVEEFIYLVDSCGLAVRLQTPDAMRARVAQSGVCRDTCKPVTDVMARVAAGATRKKPAK